MANTTMKTITAAVGAAMKQIGSAPAIAQPELALEPNDAPAVAPTPELNPRNQIAKDIAARANVDADVNAAETVVETDDEGNEVVASAPTEEEEAPPVDMPTDPAPEAPIAPAPVEANAFDPDGEYTLTVDGKPIKFKGSQIVERGKQALQKESAADFRLELASKLLLEAQARAAQPPQGAAVAPAQPAELSDEQLAEIIQFGTKEQAAQAIKAIRQQPQQQDGVKAMVEKLPQVVQDQIAFQSAVTWVQAEHGDLLTDPYLKPLFFMKENEMRKAGDARPYKEVYQEIAEGLRTHFNKPKPAAAQQAAAPQTREAKQAAKAAAPTAPKLASARMEAAAPDKPKSREEIIAAMAAARGQGPRRAQTQH